MLRATCVRWACPDELARRVRRVILPQRKHLPLVAAVASTLSLAAAAASALPQPNLAFGYPAWSSDGRRIALVGRIPAGDWYLFVVNADGSGLRRIDTTGIDEHPRWPEGIAFPSWSPNGEQIAFAAQAAGHLPSVWVIGVGGGGLRRVARNGIDPAWSPFGRKIAFSRGEETAPSWINVVNPDGTGLRRVTRVTHSESYWSPSWSPDGERLVFASGLAPDGGGGAPGLGIVRDYGGRITFLLRDRHPREPAWSPAGREIAFADEATDGSGRSLGWRTISVLDLETRRVARFRRGDSPTWSPDGSRIAFARAGSIYVMKRDGSGVRLVLRRRG